MNTSILENIKKEIQFLIPHFLNHAYFLTTAESCTGGLLSAFLTEYSGSSNWFDRGFVTYSNQAKMQMLGVLQTSLERYGAVSEKVAQEMAQGALLNSQSHVSISITGIAGPSGGSPDKPVGTVWIAIALPGVLQAQLFNFEGDRQSIRYQACLHALRLLKANFPRP